MDSFVDIGADLSLSMWFILAILYRIAGMFGGVNVWRIAELKEIGKIKLGELIDFIHKMPFIS